MERSRRSLEGLESSSQVLPSLYPEGAKLLSGGLVSVLLVEAILLSIKYFK